MTEPKRLRRDARDNTARLRAAALDIFLVRGLDVPIQEIAKAAGVSVGTLYNRFGSREAPIDAVIPDVAGARLQTLGTAVMAKPTARERLGVRPRDDRPAAGRPRRARRVAASPGTRPRLGLGLTRRE